MTSCLHLIKAILLKVKEKNKEKVEFEGTNFGIYEGLLNPIPNLPFGYICVQNSHDSKYGLEASMDIAMEGVVLLTDKYDSATS